MKDAKIFSTLDLQSGFHQIPLAPAYKEKTTLCTPWDSLQYTRCCFGLSDSPQSMQRLKDWLTADLDNVQGYIDDFLVFSATPEEHEAHLRWHFQKLHDAGLKIILKKTVLGRAEVKFCGYLISDDGIRPPPEKFDAIKNYPKPTTVKGLKSFLGAVNFYRAAIPNFATIGAPLHKLLQGKKPRFAPLVFNKEADVAFDNLKLALCNHARHFGPSSFRRRHCARF